MSIKLYIQQVYTILKYYHTLKADIKHNNFFDFMKILVPLYQQWET